MVPLYWFAYAVRPSELSRKNPPAKLSESLHMLRDGQAFIELITAFGPGHEYRGCLLNHPFKTYNPPATSAPAPRHCFEPPRHDDIDDHALVLLATRPPLDDQPDDRRWVARSGSELEGCLLSAFREIMVRCSRTELRFQAWASGLDPEDGASVQGAAPTTGFFLVHPSAEIPGREGNAVAPRTVRLAAAFGFDGTQTFVFCNLVRTRPELRATILNALSSDRPCAVRVDYPSTFPTGGPLPGRVEDLTRDLPLTIRQASPP